MPGAVFAAAALKAAAAADAVMAEGWTLLPRKPSAKVNAPDAPDPGRWSGIVSGTFVDPQARPDMPNGYDRRETHRPGTDSCHPCLLVSPAAVLAMAAAASAATSATAAAMPPLMAAIRPGDQLVRVADGIAWRAGAPFAMAGGTLKVPLSILG